MIRSIATLSMLLLALALLGTHVAEADSLLPPDDSDLAQLQAVAHDIKVLAEGNYCAGNDIRHRVPIVVEYLQNMQAWLAPARHSGIEQLKAILANEIRDTNRAAELQMIVSMQEALLQVSEMLSSTAKTAEALKSAADRLDSDNELLLLAKSDPRKLFKELSEDKSAGDDALDALKAQSETLVAKLRELPDQQSVDLPQTVKDAARRFDASLPDKLSTLSELVDLGKTLKGLYDTGKEYADVADVKATIVKWLTVAARWRQSNLSAEINALAPDIAATKTTWDTNYADYRRLRSRAETIDELIDQLSNLEYDKVPCSQPCPADLSVPPRGLSFGGRKYDPTQLAEFPSALRTYSSATTAKYASVLREVLNPWIEARIKDPPAITLDRAAPDRELGPTYLPGEPVNYKVHPGPTCHGVTLQFGWEITLPPIFSDTSGAFVPTHSGWWNASLKHNDGLYLQPDVWGVLFETRTADKYFFVPVDPCLVGRWRSKSVGLLLFQGVTGGDGIELSVSQEGVVKVIYSDMNPLRLQIVPGSPKMGEDMNSWSGSAEATADIWDRKVSLRKILDSNLTHTYRKPQQSKETTNRLTGMGPAMFEPTSPYKCDSRELSYSTKTHNFVFLRETD